MALGGFGAFIVDPAGVLLGFDQDLENLTGWPAADLVGRHKTEVRDELAGGLGRAVTLFDGDVRTGPGASRGELLLRCRDGRTLHVETVAERLAGPGERILVRVIDVLARSAPETDLGAPERRDPLTGLLDGDAFLSRLTADFGEAQARSLPLALILLDVDRFREINDRHGRPEGSEALRKLADLLRVLVEDDRRLARLGDDDFAVLLPRAGRGDAREIAASIRSAVERHRFFSGREGDGPQLTVSLGAASFPADAERPSELHERAREALDEARSLGRNRVWCYVRRPRVPVQVPVFFDGSEALLVGYSRDLSPSGLFVQTTSEIGIGMRCALSFALPGSAGRIHVIGRVVRTVAPDLTLDTAPARIPGLGVEFERFRGPSDRRALETFLHRHESETLRPERAAFSVSSSRVARAWEVVEF